MKYKVKTQMLMEEVLWIEADNEEDAKAMAHAQADYVDGCWYDAEILEEQA